MANAPEIITLKDENYIIELADGRQIHVHHGTHLNIDTRVGSVHVYDKGDKTNISLYDHFDITIEGQCKRHPTVTIDSNEYPTALIVEETESKWSPLSVADRAWRGLL